MNKYIVSFIIVVIILVIIIYYKKEHYERDETINKNNCKRKIENQKFNFVREQYDRDYEDLYDVAGELISEKTFNKKRLSVIVSNINNFNINIVNRTIQMINYKMKKFNKYSGINQPISTTEMHYDAYLKKLGVSLTNLYQIPVDNEEIYLVEILNGLIEKTKEETRHTYNIIVKKESSVKLCNLTIKIFYQDNIIQIEKININGFLKPDLGNNNRMELKPMASNKETMNKFNEYINKQKKLING